MCDRKIAYCYVHCSVHSNEAAKTPVASKSDFQGTAIFSGKYHFTDNISMRGPGDMGLINMVPIVRTMIVHVTESGVEPSDVKKRKSNAFRNTCTLNC